MSLKHFIGWSFVPIAALVVTISLPPRISISEDDVRPCTCFANSPRQAETAAKSGSTTDAIQIQGAMSRVHDPVMTKEGDTYYLLSTGRGITLHTSKDLITWEQRGRVFLQTIPWTSETIPGSTDYYWAPDISFFSGKWHLYYSISTFGKNHSAIGLATNSTLDPGSQDYRWNDEGLVIESKSSDDWNAIDPNIALD